MIVDSSAIVAIIKDEPEAPAFARAMIEAEAPRMCASNWFEVAMVADNLQAAKVHADFDELIAELGISLVPFDGALGLLARDAYRRFGRGSGHPARLNFGDCMAYALAKHSGEPLLFKGEDFIHTDVTPALN